MAEAGSGRAAAAHKLARILHHLIKHRVPYDASVLAQEEELHPPTRERSLHKQAALYGY
jgi:hypothetical protein